MDAKPVAVQLWTVRKEIAEDLAGTLRTIAGMGYKGVELWFPGDDWPEVNDLRNMLVDARLTAVGAHVPFLQLRDNFQAVAEYHAALGNEYLTIPNLGPASELTPTEDAWKQRTAEIAAIGRKCDEAGFCLSYHNHSIEFEAQVEGMDAHDYIFSNVSPAFLEAELDTYFIQKLGRDPAEYIRRFAGRVPLLHIKEMSSTPDEYANAEIGYGVIDWPEVFEAADEAGVMWYIVEQDCQEHPALVSLRMSHEFLRSCDVII